MLSSSKISAPFIHIRIDPVLSPRGSSSISKKFHLPTGTGVAFVYSALGAMLARLVGLYVSLSVLPVGLKPKLKNTSDTAWGRSEERRVGKEGGSRRGREPW